MARKNKSEINRTKEEILHFLKSKTDSLTTFSDLIEVFKVSGKDDRTFFGLVIEELLDEGKIEAMGRGKYQIAQTGSQSEVVGVLDHVNPSFGFVRYDGGQKDVFISESMLNGALDGDKVKVRLLGKTRSKGDNPEGRIVEILERGKKEWVAKVKVYANYAIAKPENRRFHEDIYIAKDHMLNAKTNDLALIEILKFPVDQQQARGRVVEVLGQSGDNDAEMHAIMADYGLPFKFPEKVEGFASAIPEAIEKKEIEKRRDERGKLTFTIDPADAKDFDDALSFVALDENVFEVGIHIADVTHYVRPGTMLEEEAFKRATSVYLVDRTIPMLPEKLSNNLCSLRPNEDKLVFSAVFQLDLKGNVLNEWFGRSIIHSDKRFSYEEAQEILELGPDAALPEGVSPNMKTCLDTLNKVAKNLKAERFKKGAFNFETKEVKFHLDEKGKPLGVYQKVRKDAHKLIEEFMLLANKRVAEFIFDAKFLHKKNAKDEESPTMVYRVHEPPNPEKLNTFSAFVGKMGFKLNISSQNALSKSLNRLMNEIEGSPVQNALEKLAVRTMSKAKYSTEATGHFGLAFDHYSHFTSPIRRYPDMMAHRILQHYLDQGGKLDKEDYEEKCVHASQQEKLAAEAERASIKYKQVEYMSFQDRSTVYEGIVTGVTDFGLFVEMKDTGCEGMVRLADLDDDYYEYDADNYRVIGQRKGRIIGFGQAVKVSVKGTDLENRSIDLNMLEASGKPIRGNKAKKGGGRKKRAKNQRLVSSPKRKKRKSRKK